MNVDQPRNLAASVRQRLLNIAKHNGEAFGLVLTRYALKRLVYSLVLVQNKIVAYKCTI